MKYLRKYEEYTGVEFIPPEEEHSSYKNTVKKKKRKKLGELEPVRVPPNQTKDVISFKRA